MTGQPANPKRASTGDDGEQTIIIRAGYEAFVVVLLFLQLANSVLWMVLPIEQARVVATVGISIGIFLTLDALVRIWQAHTSSAMRFARYRWLLLLGSLPIPGFSILRLIWYRIAVRYLRRSDFASMGRTVTTQRAKSTLLIALLMAILVLEVGGILILRVEASDANANIVGAGDALWWVLVTIATVGYGDTFPVTPAGRAVGVLVLIVGVGLFSVLTSFLANWFMHARTADPDRDSGSRTSEIAGLTAAIERHTDAQQSEIAELRARIAELENPTRDRGGG